MDRLCRPTRCRFWGGGFGTNLRQRFTRGFSSLQDGDAGGFGEGLRRHLTPTLVGAADGIDGGGLRVERQYAASQETTQTPHQCPQRGVVHDVFLVK